MGEVCRSLPAWYLLLGLWNTLFPEFLRKENRKKKIFTKNQDFRQKNQTSVAPGEENQTSLTPGEINLRCCFGLC